MATSPTPPSPTDTHADVVLIGGGIMSATLGSMLAVLEPRWRVVVLERAGALASESSDAWNNAGTGHSGFCELNYMPDPTNGSKASIIAAQFLASRQWWSYLAAQGLLDPTTFISTTAHMDVVFGEHDIAYLRERFDTLITDPLFGGMEFSDDPSVIARWAPLVMEGRPAAQRVAATRHPGGTDVDFGALTRGLTTVITSCGGEVRLGHDVRSLRRDASGSWVVRCRNRDGEFSVRSPQVFVGAGGHALRLLQRAHLPEVRGYAVLPVGAAFLRCSDPTVVSRHRSKVYGQAAVGAPPMSVPHLDRRVVDGTPHLMFGPYATFSTKLLTRGRWTDFFTTVRSHNMVVILAAMVQNVSLIRYLIGQLAARPRHRFRQLQRYYPRARRDQWTLVAAGQRAQLITPDRRRIGVIQQGTELIVSADGSMSGLLGASPGASTAVPIMVDLLRRCFPDRWRDRWAEAMSVAIPALTTARWSPELVRDVHATTGRSLGLVTHR
ncbi:malate dehydrogenase (quinone) [Williamsia sterculiae]|nr:malate dehydrogenase (quinone) [Williamsia sterculiae]